MIINKVHKKISEKMKYMIRFNDFDFSIVFNQILINFPYYKNQFIFCYHKFINFNFFKKNLKEKIINIYKLLIFWQTICSGLCFFIKEIN